MPRGCADGGRTDARCSLCGAGSRWKQQGLPRTGHHDEAQQEGRPEDREGEFCGPLARGTVATWEKLRNVYSAGSCRARAAAAALRTRPRSFALSESDRIVSPLFRGALTVACVWLLQAPVPPVRTPVDDVDRVIQQYVRSAAGQTRRPPRLRAQVANSDLAHSSQLLQVFEAGPRPRLRRASRCGPPSPISRLSAASPREPAPPHARSASPLVPPPHLPPPVALPTSYQRASFSRGSTTPPAACTRSASCSSASSAAPSPRRSGS